MVSETPFLLLGVARHGTPGFGAVRARRVTGLLAGGPRHRSLPALALRLPEAVGFDEIAEVRAWLIAREAALDMALRVLAGAGGGSASAVARRVVEARLRPELPALSGARRPPVTGQQVPVISTPSAKSAHGAPRPPDYAVDRLLSALRLHEVEIAQLGPVPAGAALVATGPCIPSRPAME
ncbi:hypothetical protein [Muricoccus pecuniae]|uniref:Uncharacterized protein n=1 Tax=Muricoccus pecuniae TaxID=693023 RepID=A0A840XZY5_9PROT|nr:hypothetical protein [Roseomonas pecuniae]MBB5694025.1 hypothetical protein [Roseomonas pecuniae]